ncbi:MULTISPECIES: hypothetical protein [unclassified Streptomyces]|uniref:hypothetical protein n=1 Tax=unclassified Streptomyces TaxID=2593676 RepID=UPI00332ED163
MGEFARRGPVVVPCKWCNKPVVQNRRWFAKQYCGRWHKWKHRVTEIVGDVLGGGA